MWIVLCCSLHHGSTKQWYGYDVSPSPCRPNPYFCFLFLPFSMPWISSSLVLLGLLHWLRGSLSSLLWAMHFQSSFFQLGYVAFVFSVKCQEFLLVCFLLTVSGFYFLTGKSTLLNNLFRTNFREMDAFKGRHVSTVLCKRAFPLLLNSNEFMGYG